MELESLFRQFPELGNIGPLYRVKCSVWLDHGFGQFTISADVDLGKSRFQLSTSGITADLETIPTRSSVAPLEVLLAALAAMMPLDGNCNPPNRKSPGVDDRLPGEARDAV